MTMTETRHLAQFNIARIRYPLDDPRMAEFVDSVARVNGLADKIPGFVWRLQDKSGNAMNMCVYDDPAILPNLTVWENVQALERFVWQTLHQRFYARRGEGVARLDHLIARGPSDYAFGWRDVAGAKLWKTARFDKPSEHAA
jgi:hypothetical protein